MITKDADKCPSDPIFYLFECYFSTFSQPSKTGMRDHEGEEFIPYHYNL